MFVLFEGVARAPTGVFAKVVRRELPALAKELSVLDARVSAAALRRKRAHGYTY